MEQVRIAERRRVLKGGKIRFNGNFSTIDCVVRDLSTAGARLKLDHGAIVPDRFRLALDQDGREFACEVRWRTLNQLGVEFEAEPHALTVPVPRP